MAGLTSEGSRDALWIRQAEATAAVQAGGGGPGLDASSGVRSVHFEWTTLM